MQTIPKSGDSIIFCCNFNIGKLVLGILINTLKLPVYEKPCIIIPFYDRHVGFFLQ